VPGFAGREKPSGPLGNWSKKRSSMGIAASRSASSWLVRFSSASSRAGHPATCCLAALASRCLTITHRQRLLS
jgi:hypothetical protein